MREPETTKFSVCEELGIGLVAWGPLGQGFLTGKITRGMKFDDPNDLRKDFPRFTPEALEANFKVVDFLKDLAARKKVTPAQIALGLAAGPEAVDRADSRWHQDRTPRRQPARRRSPPDAEDLREIDEAFATIDIKGAPLSTALDAAIDR